MKSQINSLVMEKLSQTDRENLLASGDLKWSGFQEQLGGSNPVKLSEYYRGKQLLMLVSTIKFPLVVDLLHQN